MTLLAATSDDVRPAVLIVLLAGSAIAILVASLVHTWLLLGACKLTRVRGIGIGRAWTTVLICDVVFYGFLSLMAIGLYVGIQEDRQIRTSYTFLLAPVNFLYLFAAGVLGHAAVFSPRLAETGHPPLGFGRGAAVAVVYLGLSALVLALLVVLFWILRAAVIR